MAAPSDVSALLLDVAAIAAALPAGMRSRLHVRESIDSTQQPLLDAAGHDAAGAWQDRAVIVTDHQTAGRGRRGRVWQSPPGASLALSMLAFNGSSRRWTSDVSLALGVAAAETLQHAGVSGVRLKWPNDVMVEGRKLGGILLETRPDGVVAGLGINLALPAQVRDAIGQPCTDLAESGCRAPPEVLAAALVMAWNEAFDAFLVQGLEAFLSRWIALDALAQHPVRVLSGEQVVLGVACGIDAQGQLLVETNGGMQAFSSAEVSVRTA